MATTTNFGWETPDDTDLVKDGAAAMRTLGNSIDTSFVDLKGGTTGQILAKASNTDLDYTWITNDVGDITEVAAGTGISGGGTSGSVTITNSMATAIDAKGDLIAGTGADTFSRLAVGTNGQALLADSTTATGLKWGSIGSSYSGVSLNNSGSDWSIASSTWTDLTWSAENFDTDNFHSTSTNTARVTIPTGKAGKYLIRANVNFDPNATGYRAVRFYKNGTTSTQQNQTSWTVSSSLSTQLLWVKVLDLIVGDYITLQVLQNTGSNLLVYESATSFDVTYLGA